MAIQKTDAIVLRTMPFRSSSLIVTFYTKDFGKIRGVAKGVRREKELRGAMFEIMSELEIIYYEKAKSDLFLISDVALLQSPMSLNRHLESIAYASYFCELVDRVTELQDPHPEIYELLKFSYKYLSAVPYERIARIFEVRLLREIGWIPYLEGCGDCDKPLGEQASFSVKQGVCLCRDCAKASPESRPLSADALKHLRQFSTRSLEESLKQHVGVPTVKELGVLLSYFLLYRLGYPLKTGQFLDKIRPVLTTS